MFKINLSFRYQFLIFFVLSSILPLLIFSGIFLHKSTTILMSRNAELLQTGIILWEEVVADTLDKLELNANHLALRSYDKGVAVKHLQWPQALQHGPSEPLMMLYNQEGKALQSVFPTHLNPRHCATDIQKALKAFQPQILSGHPVKGLFAVPGCQSKGSLMLLVAVPVLSDQNNQPVNAVLVLGQPIESLIHSKDMAELPKDFIYRIVEKDPQGMHTVAATLTDLSTQTPPLYALKQHAGNSVVFEEKTSLQKYRSQAHSLLDVNKVARGYVVVSLSQYYADELARENTLYVVGFLLIAIMLLTLLGARFNRLFIQPMHLLSATSRLVATGNLKVRVPILSADAEMSQTLNGFNRMLDQLQEKETIRQTFISTLTHDLRTPLIAQKRVLEFFRSYVKPELDEQSGKLLEDMHQSNQNLLEMIHHLLETFQYESGRIHLHPKPTSLRAVVQNCFQSLHPLASGKQITLENLVTEDFQVCVDGPQFQRVLQNLMGNSLQNIADGDTMTVSAHHDEAAQTAYNRIIVSDTGPGIPAELLAHLFERYPQHLTRQQQIGSGLGLFICKMIIELHGGTISVSSAPEQGTVFEIKLPKTGKPPHHG